MITALLDIRYPSSHPNHNRRSGSKKFLEVADEDGPWEIESKAGGQLEKAAANFSRIRAWVRST
jgi:hypothetical protein